MLRKIHQKILFLRKLVGIGADFPSRRILMLKALRNSYHRTPFPVVPFSCRVHVSRNSAVLQFTGTMGEIHTLLDIFADHSYAPQDGHLDTLFSNNPRTMLDLGANIGLATAWFALSFPEMRIDAYEPNPHVFELLKENAAQFPNVRVFEKAIEGHEGSVTFNQSEHTLESSVYEARDSAAHTVAATTIDNAIDAIGGSVDIMKIDIEGSEFRAFAASSKLANIRVMTGEAHTAQSGHSEEELVELLHSFDQINIYNPNHADVFGFYAAHTTPARN